MCRKLFYLVSFFFVLSVALTNVAKAVDPDLVGWTATTVPFRAIHNGWPGISAGRCNLMESTKEWKYHMPRS